MRLKRLQFAGRRARCRLPDAVTAFTLAADSLPATERTAAFSAGLHTWADY